MTEDNLVELYQMAHQAQQRAVAARKRRVARQGLRPAIRPHNPDNPQKLHRPHGPGRLHGARGRDATAGAPPPSALPGSPTQQRGQMAESRAAAWLAARGLTLLERNLRCKGGEIDLVARDGPQLVFIEVRLRACARFGGAAASIDARKQARIARAARFHLPGLAARHFGGRIPPCRFDVVSIDGRRTEWIRHAFSGRGEPGVKVR